MKEKTIFDFSKLEGLIKEYYDTQAKFAAEIPMARSTLYQKLNNNVDFNSQEIIKISELLNIKTEDIGVVFFKELNPEIRS